MALGSDQVTITTAANLIPETWGPMVIKATEDNLVMWKLTWDWSGEEAGDIINVPGISNFSSTTKSANTQVVLTGNTEGVTQLTVTTHQHSAFLLEDIVKVLSSFNNSMYYTQKAGFAVAEAMDTTAGNLISGLSQQLGSAGVDIGDGEVRDAIEFLDLQNAPDSDRHLVLYPTQKNAMFGIEKYFRADFQGNGASGILTKGKFGSIYGVNTYVSNNLGVSAGARLNAMFHRECFATAQKYAPRTQSQYKLEYLGTLTVVDTIYGAVEARDGFGVWLKS